MGVNEVINLPEIPARMARLPKDSRGYPVPWFVAWLNETGEPVKRGEGKPDFRVIYPGAIAEAWKRGRCWLCGDVLGRHRVFAIGPMCVVNRVTSEPPSHRDCAEFAAKACPFLTNPREKRSEKNMPEDHVTAGIPIKRNPGVVALYETLAARPFNPGHGGHGVLFRLGNPDRVDWWARGRAATREEVDEAISTGMPFLVEQAKLDGSEAMRELQAMFASCLPLLPQQAASDAAGGGA